MGFKQPIVALDELILINREYSNVSDCNNEKIKLITFSNYLRCNEISINMYKKYENKVMFDTQE